MTDFFNHGVLLGAIKTSFITLVPKKANPLWVEDYRPISLFHGLYKNVAKLLANRLKGVLEIMWLVRLKPLSFRISKSLTVSSWPVQLLILVVNLILGILCLKWTLKKPLIQ